MSRRSGTIFINVCIYLVFVIGISLLYTSEFYANLLAILLLIFNFICFHDRRDFIYFLIGFCLTTSTEILAVRFGVWEYAYPHLFGIPLWLSLGWAYSFVFAREFEGNLFKQKYLEAHYASYFRKAKNIILTDLLVFGVSLLAILLLWKDNALLTTCLGLFLIFYIFIHHDKDSLALILIAVFSYSLIDAAMTHIGLWTYTNTNLSTITTCLPIGYGLIAVLVSRISESINILVFSKKT